MNLNYHGNTFDETSSWPSCQMARVARHAANLVLTKLRLDMQNGHKDFYDSICVIIVLTQVILCRVIKFGTLRPKRKGRNLAGNILKCIFFNLIFWIWNKILSKHFASAWLKKVSISLCKACCLSGIPSKRRFDVIITCLLRCVFAGQRVIINTNVDPNVGHNMSTKYSGIPL